MLKLVYHTILLCFCSTNLLAQQISSFGNVDVIDSYYNPAFTAFENDVRGAVLYRKFQSTSNSYSNINWQDLVALTEFNVDKWNSGIGLKLHQEKIAFSRTRGAEINYRYQLNLNEKSRLAFGIGGGYLDFKWNFSELFFPDGTPEQFNENLESGISLNTGIGFSWDERLYVGASVMQLNEPRVGNMQYSSHYALHGHYLFNILDNMALQPQFLWLFTQNVNMLRVNLKSYHYNRFWWMASSGLDFQFMGALGVRLWEKIDIGYGIDFFSKNNNNLLNGFIHEVVLAYRLR